MLQWNKKIIKLTMLKNERVREEKANIKIFTWFGNSRLHPCLQANQAWGFHYPSLPRLQMRTIDYQDVNGPLQQDIIPNLFTQSVSHTYTLTNFTMNSKNTINSLF